MSVTVADLMKLPSLQHATVLAGSRGLSKIVSSISVLELADPGALVDELFPQGEYLGSEIVITGFLNTIEDIDRQCASISRLAQGGEVGLILFYVGVFLPRVDQRLIDLANQLDFVLICMPVGQKNLRYAEIITDVMGCIFRDKSKNESLVLDILERISALPKHQQTVDTGLKMLSDSICASVVLCDDAFHILNLAAWPRRLDETIAADIVKSASFPEDGADAPCPFLPNSRIYRMTLSTDGQPVELLLIKEGPQLNQATLEQAADVTRICINLWGRHHGKIAIHELVRSILRDEPLKMQRLADIFHIDIDSIHELWILHSHPRSTGSSLRELTGPLRELLADYSGAFFADYYGDQLLIFLSTPVTQQEAEERIQSILSLADGVDETVSLTRCAGLQTTADVRRAYLCHKDSLSDARKIFPLRRSFSLGEMEFAQSCRQMIQSGELALTRALAPLEIVRTDNSEMDLLYTVCVFLLDGESSVTKTAQFLYLHANTVKYRIHRATDLLGYRPDRMPKSMELYRAAAVYRLLHE